MLNASIKCTFYICASTTVHTAINLKTKSLGLTFKKYDQKWRHATVIYDTRKNKWKSDKLLTQWRQDKHLHVFNKSNLSKCKNCLIATVHYAGLSCSEVFDSIWYGSTSTMDTIFSSNNHYRQKVGSNASHQRYLQTENNWYYSFINSTGQIMVTAIPKKSPNLLSLDFSVLFHNDCLTNLLTAFCCQGFCILNAYLYYRDLYTFKQPWKLGHSIWLTLSISFFSIYLWHIMFHQHTRPHAHAQTSILSCIQHE